MNYKETKFFQIKEDPNFCLTKKLLQRSSSLFYRKPIKFYKLGHSNIKPISQTQPNQQNNHGPIGLTKKSSKITASTKSKKPIMGINHRPNKVCDLIP